MIELAGQELCMCGRPLLIFQNKLLFCSNDNQLGWSLCHAQPAYSRFVNMLLQLALRYITREIDKFSLVRISTNLFKFMIRMRSRDNTRVANITHKNGNGDYRSLQFLINIKSDTDLIPRNLEQPLICRIFGNIISSQTQVQGVSTTGVHTCGAGTDDC